MPWAPAVNWKATLAGAGLNPGAQWKEVPGKLNLRLKSDGGLDDGKLRANVLLEELTGTLSGQTLRGSADVSVLDQDLTVKDPAFERWSSPAGGGRHAGETLGFCAGP